jgi:hypothetical protein
MITACSSATNLKPPKDGLVYSCAYSEHRIISEDGAAHIQPLIRNISCRDIGWFGTELRCSYEVRMFDYGTNNWDPTSHWKSGTGTFRNLQRPGDAGGAAWCWDSQSRIE